MKNSLWLKINFFSIWKFLRYWWWWFFKVVNRTCSTRGYGSLSGRTQSLSVQAGRGQGNFSLEQFTERLKTLRAYHLINCLTEHLVEGRGMN